MPSDLIASENHIWFKTNGIHQKPSHNTTIYKCVQKGGDVEKEVVVEAEEVEVVVSEA
jgi:hypothetical protein